MQKGDLPTDYSGKGAVKIKPIKTETDYQAALAEIERLFDAAPDTPEGDGSVGDAGRGLQRQAL